MVNCLLWTQGPSCFTRKALLCATRYGRQTLVRNRIDRRIFPLPSRGVGSGLGLLYWTFAYV